MYRLALNMLFGDRAKLAMLLCGLSFSALLMAQQSSVFFGIMSWTYTPMVNIRASVWVSDSEVEQVNDAKPMRDTDVTRVRSVDGVSWAAPLHSSIMQARMPNGKFKLISLVGIDSDTFAGAPAVLTQGNIEDLRLPNTVLVDEWGANLLGRTVVQPDGSEKIVPLGIGDTFFSAHGLQDATDVHTDKTFTVVGIYAKNRTVVDLLESLAAGGRLGPAGGMRVATCGPDAMMAAVARWTAAREIPCDASLETPMACGIGICFTCVAAIRDADGGWDYRRTCVEGPVFDAASIVW